MFICVYDGKHNLQAVKRIKQIILEMDIFSRWHLSLMPFYDIEIANIVSGADINLQIDWADLG